MPGRNTTSRALRRVLWGAATAALLPAAACGMASDRQRMADAAALTSGDPRQGRELIRHFGCGSCHTVPGVRGARATVGPPLAGIGSRMYIAGLLANNPANLARWIQDPPAVDSLTAMPNLGVSAEEARHIAAYLYSLRE